MLTILIFFLGICLFIGIIKAIFERLKDIILGVLGIIIIIAIGSVVVSAIGAVIPIALALLPVILVILAGLFILGYIIILYDKIKYRSQLKWLSIRGIDKISNSAQEWNKPVELGFVETTSDGYVVSTSFYKKVIEKIGRRSTLTQGDAAKYCSQIAPQFQIIYLRPLLDFLRTKNLLFPFITSTGENIYLSEPFVKKCEDLFLNEGAATRDEFAQIVETSPVVQDFKQDNWKLADFILGLMLSNDEVDEIDLPDLGEQLYVARKQKSNSKLVRREITL